MAILIFTPSGPGHHFNALIGSGYVSVKNPGPIEVADDQVEVLLKMYPQNFQLQPPPEKAVTKPAEDRALPKGKHSRTRLKKKGGD